MEILLSPDFLFQVLAMTFSVVSSEKIHLSYLNGCPFLFKAQSTETIRILVVTSRNFSFHHRNENCMDYSLITTKLCNCAVTEYCFLLTCSPSLSLIYIYSVPDLFAECSPVLSITVVTSYS